MEEDNLEDIDLIYGLKSGTDSGAYLKELVNRHSGIYISMVNNYSPPMNSSIPSNKDELIKDKDYYIYQAALKFDENKNTKFSTYLGNETRWLCLNLYNKNKKSKEVSGEIENLTSIEDESLSKLDEEFITKAMSVIKKDPDKRMIKIFRLRYIDGEKNKVMPWNKVCKFVDLSIQGCINIHDKAIKKIRKELNKDL